MKSNAWLSRGNVTLFVIGLVYFVYIVLRAALIPVTHDESNTCMMYSVMPVKDIVTYKVPIPNNHILNTLLIKLLSNWFGMKPFVVRLPNVLGFVLYYVIGVSLLRMLSRNAWFVAFGLVLLLCNPFVVDFFSLARGYALSMTFILASVYFLLRFWLNGKTSELTWTFVFAAVASYTNFTALNYYASLLMLVFMITLMDWKRLTAKTILNRVLVATLVSFVLGAASYLPIKRMRETDQFVFWGTTGFYHDTVRPLVESSKYGVDYFKLDMDYYTWFFIALFVVGLIAFVALRERGGFRAFVQSPTTLFALLLLLTITVNVVQFHSIKTPYLNPRTALSFYLLTALSFIGFGYFLLLLKPLAFRVVAIFFLLFGGSHMLRAANLKRCQEWRYDENTYDVLNYLHKQYDAEPRKEKITLNLTWLFAPSFHFYTETVHADWIDVAPYHHDIQPDSLRYKYYYATGDDKPTLDSNYTAILNFDGARFLMMRK